MERVRLGRYLLTFLLAGQAVSAFFLDWSSNHLLHPLWHPHARFHGALLLFLLAGVSATGLWMLWRKSLEPEVGITAAALICVSFWSPFFYATFLLPQASLWAGDPARVPHLGGSVFYPNVAVAGACLLLTGVAWMLCRSNSAGLKKSRAG